MVGRENSGLVHGGFQKEPLLDFAQAENQRQFQAALESVQQQCGRSYPLIINDEPSTTDTSLISRNPSHPETIIGQVARERRVQAAQQTFPAWRATPVEERIDVLLRAADEMRLELAGWEVLKAGKPWREADADVCEAIDFLVYHAHEMRRLAAGQPLDDEPGEANAYFYQARGSAAVLAPWNFPVAILTGMAAAALVTGNSVIMKPAEQTPVTVAKLMDIFRSAGLPPGVLSYLPGLGEEVAEYLVTHPLINIVAFTGSREVGLRINALAAQTTQGQRGIKKVIAEMGGKNAIIVDDDADLDEAVQGFLSGSSSPMPTIRRPALFTYIERPLTSAMPIKSVVASRMASNRACVCSAPCRAPSAASRSVTRPRRC